MFTHQTQSQQDLQPVASLGVWHLLHIEPDDAETQNLKQMLGDALSNGLCIDHVSSLEQAHELLQQSEFDAVLLGLNDSSPKNMDRVRHFTTDIDGTPVILLSGDDNLRAADSASRNGATAFLLKSELTSEQLGDTLHQALTHPTYDSEMPERRKEPHYHLEAAAVIYPIESDGKPGREIAATAVDISQNGIVVLAEQDSDLIPDICLLGIECPDGITRYATVEWRSCQLALPAIRLSGRFLRRVDDPLHASRLTPRFDPHQLRYKSSFDSKAIHQWIRRGILRPQVVDHVKVCPQCEALPTFREGCPQCGSGKIGTSQLIHHFACDYTAPAAEFDCESLTCPQCRKRELVVGTDFEYLSGPPHCLECAWSDETLALIGECLRCRHRFVGSEALEREVLEYHLDRLDPLALIDSAK